MKTVKSMGEVNRQSKCPECGAELDYETDGETGVVWESCDDLCGHQDAVAQMEAIR